MRYAVCVESDLTGWSSAHAVGLPGCAATAADAPAALDGLFQAIPAYWAWLRRHGVAAPGPDDVGEVTLGVIEFVRDGVPGGGALFEYESGPLTRPAVESALDRLAFSRADLLALVGDLPAAVLAPAGENSVGGVLAHLAATEQGWTARLAADPPAPPTAAPLAALAVTRAAALAQIRALPEADYGRVFLHGAERWNLRKLLRRMIEHERAYTAQIARLLGVPPTDAE